MSLLNKEQIVNDINGYFILDKEKGYTSNDSLSIVKRLLHPKKLGHTGTLDVNATGVLVCLLGDATKRQEYLMKTGDKIYDAELVLGFSTDTEDFTGKILDIDPLIIKTVVDNDSSAFNSLYNKVTEVCKSFIGDYEQVPPMYSAKKINGKKLIDIARGGNEVERKACHVSIKSIDVYGFDTLSFKYDDEDLKLKVIKLKVVCSKGTYIRTLCKDIGEKIGIPSCMGNLRRLATGDFKIEDAIRLDTINEKVNKGDYSFIKPCYYSNNSNVVTFGKFETLHLGHMKIIKTLVNEAKNMNVQSTVIIVGDNANNEIISKEQRISKLKYLGVDNIINYKLNFNNCRLSAEDFLSKVLIKQLKSRAIVVGDDARFGYMGNGDVNLLKKICEPKGVGVIVVDKLKTNDGRVISSTLLKNEYANGNLDFVNELLGKN